MHGQRLLPRDELLFGSRGTYPHSPSRSTSAKPGGSPAADRLSAAPHRLHRTGHHHRIDPSASQSACSATTGSPGGKHCQRCAVRPEGIAVPSASCSQTLTTPSTDSPLVSGRNRKTRRPLWDTCGQPLQPPDCPSSEPQEVRHTGWVPPRGKARRAAPGPLARSADHLQMLLAAALTPMRRGSAVPGPAARRAPRPPT
jgi:hypothetical protein